MKTGNTIGEKERLDIIGIQKRSQFLSEYSAELNKQRTVMAVHESYSLLFDCILGSLSRFMSSRTKCLS